MPDMTDKICMKCLKSRPLATFHKNASKPDGHGSICKLCASEVARLRAKRERLVRDRAKYGEDFVGR